MPMITPTPRIGKYPGAAPKAAAKVLTRKPAKRKPSKQKSAIVPMARGLINR